jgi:hypothetical protein
MTHESKSWLTENEVVDAVAEHLRKTGWRNVITCNTTQQGIDVCAERDGITLAVEAKGGGSSKKGTARYGMPFDNGQKEKHVAVAVLTAMREASKGVNQAAIAVPDDATHVRLIGEISPALQRLNIVVYFVAPDKSVKLGMFAAAA